MPPRGSALKSLCRREGTRETREHSGQCFLQSRLAQCKSDHKNTCAIVQPPRTEKGHGTKYKVEKKHFMDQIRFLQNNEPVLERISKEEHSARVNEIQPVSCSEASKAKTLPVQRVCLRQISHRGCI